MLARSNVTAAFGCWLRAGATDDQLAGLAEYSVETRDASIDAVVNDVVSQLEPDDNGPVSVN